MSELNHRDLKILLLLMTSAGMMILPRLGQQVLWQDEAQTAVVSTTILTRGLPYGTDGKNFFSQEAGAEYGNNYIWKWHTWLSFYTVAAFFALFGKSTLAARMPFAIFGILTIGLQYLITKDLWNSRRAAVLSTLALLTNVPFLILSRQCRYYTMAAFFSIGLLYAYVGILQKRRWSYPAYVTSAVCLFHTFHVSLFPPMAAVLIHCGLFHRHRLRKQIFVSALSMALIFPWMMWMSNFGYFHRYSLTAPMILISKFLFELTPLLFPATFLGAGGLLLVASWRLWEYRPSFQSVRAQGAILLVLFWFLTCLLLGLIGPGPYFRYLASVIPAASAIAGIMIDDLMGVRRWLGVLLLGIWFATQPLWNYGYELTHRYRGPMDGYIQYLQRHGRDNETVAITYEDMPLKFYTKMRVLGGLTGEDLGPARQADWIILRRHPMGSGDGAVLSWITENVPRKNYREIELPFPDTMFQNRENPVKHQYRTASQEKNILLFERIGRGGNEDRRGFTSGTAGSQNIQ